MIPLMIILMFDIFGLGAIEDTEQWLAYEYGVCRFIDGLTKEKCLEMAGPVQWPGLNGAQAYDKWYGEGKEEWVFGENPRLGYGPYGD